MANWDDMKLTIELVPKTSWFSNVRDALSTTDWNTVKRFTAQHADRRCEICGGVGPKWPVECHEVWHYDDTNHVQTLKRTIALCPTCHAVKHFGFNMTKFPNRVPKLIQHIATVNGISMQEAEDYIVHSFDVWTQRSQHNWEVDLSWISKKFPNMTIKDHYSK